jgi:putative FmdB family regulatory protein
MPFYEYQCSNCGHDMEAMQKINDSPLKKCPECGKSALKRLMSAPVFRLKGGGWYETDFKSDQDGKRNLADRPEADAPKEDKKDAKGEAAKDTAAAKDDKKPGDKPADKPAEKSAEKAATAEPAKKPAASPLSKRGAASVPVKSGSKQPSKRAKKPAPKPKRRR